MIITLEEVKAILGIVDNKEDNTISSLIQSAENIILEIIGVSDLLSHSVVDEKLTIYNPKRFFIKEFPVDINTIVLKDYNFNIIEVDEFYIPHNFLRAVYMKNSDNTQKTVDYGEYNISYTAGYATADNIPQDIKTATAFILNGLLASNDSKNGTIESYRIDDVISVKFASKIEATQTTTLLKKYAI